MKNYFEIKTAKQLKLADFPVKAAPQWKSAEEYRTLLEKKRERLGELQTMLYAGRSRAVLVIFQGMDTSGKDSAIKHVMSGVNPQGCTVTSFKAPTPTECEHDFLWRINLALPARGQIGIFNRSHYEEVLVTRVHPELLALQKIPNPGKKDTALWHSRYQDIVNYEAYLQRQGYEIIKIFLHISKEEQKRRLQARFSNPKKLWKVSEGDIRERKFWREYQTAYEDCLRHTSSKKCPWYIVPGDDKEVARLSVSKILVDRMKKLQLQYPQLGREEEKKLKKLKAQLASE